MGFFYVGPLILRLFGLEMHYLMFMNDSMALIFYSELCLCWKIFKILFHQNQKIENFKWILVLLAVVYVCLFFAPVFLLTLEFHIEEIMQCNNLHVLSYDRLSSITVVCVHLCKGAVQKLMIQ